MAFAVINPFFQFFDNVGEPLDGGTVETYESGTSTPKVTYQDATLSTPNSTTITLNSAGRCSMFVGDGETFKYILKDSSGVTIDTKDGVKSPVGTQAEIGELLYPRTSTEIAAGVTPVNYYKEPGNVLRYGTNTTPGTTDMSAAIQAAVDANDNVFLPDGIYRVDTGITLRGGIRFEGETHDGTRIQAGAAVAILTCDGSFSNLTLRNLLLDGNSVGTRGFSSSSTSQGSSSILTMEQVHVANCTTYNIYIRNMTYGVLRDVVSSNSPYGVYLDNCFDLDLEGKCVLYDCTTSALLLYVCSNVKAINAKIFNNASVTAPRLVWIDSCINSGLMGCTLEAQGTSTISYEMDVDKTQSQNCVDTFFYDCDFIGAAGAKGRCVRLGATAQVHKPRFFNCRFLKPTSDESVQVASAAHAVFDECRDVTSYSQVDWVPPTIQKDVAGEEVHVLNRALAGTPREIMRYAASSSENVDQLQLTSEYAPAGTGTATSAGFGGGIAFGSRSPGNVFRRDMARIAVQVVAADNGGDLVLYTRPNSSTAATARVRIKYNGRVAFDTMPSNFADDAAAAVGGIAVGEMYRNGSVLMVRVA